MNFRQPKDKVVVQRLVSSLDLLTWHYCVQILLDVKIFSQELHFYVSDYDHHL